MDDNRYAPPKANVEGADSDAGVAPPLWNPNAAASWCLLLTPVFGTWLHLKNWIALGEAERARVAWMWLIAAIVVTLMGPLAWALMLKTSVHGAFRLVVLAFLIAWYYASAKSQAQFVKKRFGDDYPRRGWGTPILVAIGLFIAWLFVAGLMIWARHLA